MTRQLAKHAVVQITLVAYCVLISGAGVRLAKAFERPPSIFIHWLHDYGFLLLLIPAALFFINIRDSQRTEPWEESEEKAVSHLATGGSVALVACAFCLSLSVLIDGTLLVSKQEDAQKPVTLRGAAVP